MGIYADVVSSWTMDLNLRRADVSALPRQLLSEAMEPVLEVGFGTGVMALTRSVQLCFATGLVMALAACSSPAKPPTSSGSAIESSEYRGAADAADPSRGYGGLSKRVDALVRSAQKDIGAAGVSVAVSWHEKPVLIQGYRFANVAGNEVMRADHIFRIGSLTKSFTAAAILKLESQGKLTLSDPLVKHLPDYTASNAITLRHLLTHTSGIRNYVDVPGFGARRADAKTRAELAALFSELPLEFPPGSAWAYSNSGYFLLGLVIEETSGRTYADLVQAELLGPAGLADTRYCPDAQDYPSAAIGYKHVGGNLALAESIMMTLPFAAGALCSTANDLVRWLSALSHGNVVAPADFGRMSQPTVLSGGKTVPYGFGLAPRAVGGHACIGHIGQINGFASALQYYPVDDLYIAVLVNTEIEEAANDIAEKIARTVFDLKGQAR